MIRVRVKIRDRSMIRVRIRVKVTVRDRSMVTSARSCFHKLALVLHARTTGVGSLACGLDDRPDDVMPDVDGRCALCSKIFVRYPGRLSRLSSLV